MLFYYYLVIIYYYYLVYNTNVTVKLDHIKLDNKVSSSDHGLAKESQYRSQVEI